MKEIYGRSPVYEGLEAIKELHIAGRQMLKREGMKKEIFGDKRFITLTNRWTIFKVWLFGKKFVDYRGGYTLVAYLYKGIYYITKYRKEC